MQNVTLRENAYSQIGRTLLIIVTVIALALQALKLGSRGLFLGKWPTGGQWGQLCIVVWLLFSLWEGKSWARIVTALYFSLAAFVGSGVLVLMWPGASPALRAVTVVILLLCVVEAAILWFSTALRWHMSERLAAAEA